MPLRANLTGTSPTRGSDRRISSGSSVYSDTGAKTGLLPIGHRFSFEEITTRFPQADFRPIIAGRRKSGPSSGIVRYLTGIQRMGRGYHIPVAPLFTGYISAAVKLCSSG